ncbi:MAG: ATP-binding protein [Eubacteriales bacterium]|nr:ATP-binding protein [Eubacteriales bacterium]
MYSDAKHSGTDLGMAITKELADLMNAEIRVTSEVGRGSRFVMTVPFDLAASVGATEETGNEDVSLEAHHFAGGRQQSEPAGGGVCAL